jgi:hypothetical protein
MVGSLTILGTLVILWLARFLWCLSTGLARSGCLVLSSTLARSTRLVLSLGLAHIPDEPGTYLKRDAIV